MYKAIVKPVYRCQVPTCPDGSPALLPLDQSPVNEHQLNFHGWPANAIQEYINSDDLKMKEMILQKIGVNPSINSGDRNLSPQEMISLCPSRYAQTASEYLYEGVRIDKIRADIQAARDRVARSSSKENTIKFKEGDAPSAQE